MAGTALVRFFMADPVFRFACRGTVSCFIPGSQGIPEVTQTVGTFLGFYPALPRSALVCRPVYGSTDRPESPSRSLFVREAAIEIHRRTASA